MTLFSQRKGLIPVRMTLQIDSMDTDLRNRLWDIVSVFYWKAHGYYLSHDGNNHQLQLIVRRIWHSYFKKPMDTIDDRWPLCLGELRAYFFGCPWHGVYDFIEFIAQNYRDAGANDGFRAACNVVLEQEHAAYRFVGEEIAQITSEAEIEEIELAIKPRTGSDHIAEHFQRSLELLADREKPDWRNSIKEAISGVEATCRVVAHNPKATLGDALKQVSKRTKLHPALESAFDKLYGYSSDADGIRHALSSADSLEYEDAKFMLVSCAAFSNYLLAKATKAGVKL